MSIIFNNGRQEHPPAPLVPQAPRGPSVRVVVNGKQCVHQGEHATVESLANLDPRNQDKRGRSVYLERDGKHTRLERGKSYPIQKGDKIKTAPDRVKGSPVGSYFGVKEPWRKELIRQQVANLAEKRFRRGQVELDDTCNYVLFHNFTLTSAWRQANPDSEFVTIMLLLPDQYPDLPPNGFYMPDYLKPPPGETHWFASDYTWGGNAASQGIKMQGWNWYCTHVAEGSWSPARLQRVEDWSKGDNLWDIMRMVTDVLTDPTAN